jgi:hypothetical protein
MTTSGGQRIQSSKKYLAPNRLVIAFCRAIDDAGGYGGGEGKCVSGRSRRQAGHQQMPGSIGTIAFGIDRRPDCWQALPDSRDSSPCRNSRRRRASAAASMRYARGQMHRSRRERDCRRPAYDPGPSLQLHVRAVCTECGARWPRLSISVAVENASRVVPDRSGRVEEQQGSRFNPHWRLIGRKVPSEPSRPGHSSAQSCGRRCRRPVRQ